MREYCEYKDVEKFFNIDKLKKSKKKIGFKCEICGEDCFMSFQSMFRRKICGVKKICTKCCVKYVTSSDEWKDSNSKAQYIAQNRPDVIEKQREAQKRLIDSDPLYVDKRCSKSYVSGIIRNIRFDTSWELYFLCYCWESESIEKIERYTGSIKYLDANGKNRLYFPDFVVYYKSGKKIIVEIKGSKKYNNFLEKFNAAREKHGINYIVYEERDLINLGIFFKRETYLRDFYRKYNSEIHFFNNKKRIILKVEL